MKMTKHLNLNDIKECHVCHNNNLEILVNVPISNLLTDEETIQNVMKCNDCDTIHYIEEGEIRYEFSCKIYKIIKAKNIKHIYEE